MTRRHLTPEQFVDVVERDDRPIPIAVAAHLAECAACAGEVDRLRDALGAARADEPMSEPSPLFWTHWTSRTIEAARAQPAARWWSSRWTAALWVAAAVAAAVLVVRVSVLRTIDNSAPDEVTAAMTDINPNVPAIDDGSFGLVVDLASQVPWEDVQQAARPRAGTADTLIDELSPAEREQLVKLLKSEIGDLE